MTRAWLLFFTLTFGAPGLLPVDYAVARRRWCRLSPILSPVAYTVASFPTVLSPIVMLACGLAACRLVSVASGPACFSCFVRSTIGLRRGVPAAYASVCLVLSPLVACAVDVVAVFTRLWLDVYAVPFLPANRGGGRSALLDGVGVICCQYVANYGFPVLGISPLSALRCRGRLRWSFLFDASLLPPPSSMPGGGSRLDAAHRCVVLSSPSPVRGWGD